MIRFTQGQTPIPPDIWNRMTMLPFHDQVVMLTILRLTLGEMRFEAPIPTKELARRTNMSEEQIELAVQQLQDAGLVELRPDKHKMLYRPIFELPQPNNQVHI